MGASTRVSMFVSAPRHAVYTACLDPDRLVRWRVPDGMVGKMHVFQPLVGGRVRMSLTYRGAAHANAGKTSDDTDTYNGTFLELIPDELIVEAVDFESDDPAFAGQMRITTRFVDAGEGTEVTLVCDNIPSGIDPADNEEGTRQSLQKLAALFA